jgi:DNA-binding SARP family transcriptional activator
MFGQFWAVSESREIRRFSTQKTVSLFALLALSPGKRHLREELIDALWPDAPLDAALNRHTQARDVYPLVKRLSAARRADAVSI